MPFYLTNFKYINKIIILICFTETVGTKILPFVIVHDRMPMILDGGAITNIKSSFRKFIKRRW